MSVLRQDNRCFGCKKYLNKSAKSRDLKPDEVSSMKICDSCETANYCSAKCKKDDWNNHKKACQRMRSLLNDLEFMAMESNGQVGNTEAMLHMNAMFAQLMQVKKYIQDFFKT